MVATQHDDEVNPSLGEYVTRVPVENDAAGRGDGLELVYDLGSSTADVRRNGRGNEYLVFIDCIALPLLVKTFMETLLLDEVAHVNIPKGHGRLQREQFSMRRFPSAWCSSNEDGWELPGFLVVCHGLRERVLIAGTGNNRTVLFLELEFGEYCDAASLPDHAEYSQPCSAGRRLYFLNAANLRTSPFYMDIGLPSQQPSYFSQEHALSPSAVICLFSFARTHWMLSTASVCLFC